MNDIIARRKLRVNNGKRKRPIEDEGTEVDDDDDEGTKKPKLKTHVEEQEELRKEVVSAFHGRGMLKL